MDQLEIVVYSRARCPYCWRARRLLRRNGYAFEEIDVGKDEGLRERLIRSTGQKTVPLVLLDGRLLGGLDDLRRLERTGDLERLVRGRSWAQQTVGRGARELPDPMGSIAKGRTSRGVGKAAKEKATKKSPLGAERRAIE